MRTWAEKCRPFGELGHLISRGHLQIYKVCERQNVNVFQNLSFAKAFLLEEQGLPSPASSLSAPTPTTEHEGEDETMAEGAEKLPGLMWLVEKRHPSSHIVRFSGTLQHPSAHSDLMHLTIYAFNHFVFGHTNHQLVFADLQATPVAAVSKQGKKVEGFQLFDPMTHTTTGCSGVGDFGRVGIDGFVRQHECREICNLLGFPDAIPLVTSSPADSNSGGEE
ncbi:kinase-like domain-containing protein [Coprinopsis sp. MPI-PUGE-AT-0042]|nr:kinase-like domain-containing protein [Coprinopsis sp. MPI-PUGE-AT-0042]